MTNYPWNGRCSRPCPRPRPRLCPRPRPRWCWFFRPRRRTSAATMLFRRRRTRVSRASCLASRFCLVSRARTICIRTPCSGRCLCCSSAICSSWAAHPNGKGRGGEEEAKTGCSATPGSGFWGEGDADADGGASDDGGDDQGNCLLEP